MLIKNVCSLPPYLTCKKLSWFLSLLIVFYSCDQPAKFHFLKYDSASVVRWVDSTTTPNFGRLILQFYAPKVGESQKNLEAIAYAMDTSGNYLPSSPDTLTKVSDSLKKFKGTAVFGNNVLTRQKLLKTITDSTSQIISFDYIYLEPFLDTTHRRHLYYRIFATKNGKRILHKIADDDQESDPCPPAQCFWK